jgi:4-amino-4-deoxy-L-arabinose transferase-like glycosyltransferase
MFTGAYLFLSLLNNAGKDNYKMKIKFHRESLLIILAAVIALIIINSLFSYGIFRDSDEVYYLHYTKEILKGGIPAFKSLPAAYLADANYRGHPTPLRFGFIILYALSYGLFGASFISIVLVSIFFLFAAVFIAYVFFRKTWGQDAAFLGGLLLLTSPLAIALSRRALPESASNFFLLAVVILQIDYFTTGCKAWKRWCVAGLLSLALMIRETNILFIFPLAVSSLAFLSNKNFKAIVKSWIIMYIVPPASVIVLYRFLFGNVFAELGAIYLTSSVKCSNYVMNYQSGPWFRYLVDFMLISPWVTILGVYYAVNTLIKKKRPGELALALFMTATVFIFSFFSKNIRYVSILDYPLRLFVVLALLSIDIVDRKKALFFIALTIAIAISIFDLVNFFRFFVGSGIYDPVSFRFLLFWKFIPAKF